MIKFVIVILSFLYVLVLPLAYNTINANNRKISGSKPETNILNDRRAFLTTTTIQLPLSIFAVTASAPLPSAAFDNRLDDRYLDRTPQTGAQPTNLGARSRTSAATSKSQNYQGLAPCDGRPNCWCSSTPFEDNPARYIKPWNSSKASAKNKSIVDVKKVVDTYRVGQKDIDGGGFNIIEFDETKGYLYVQFQSYKNGFIDDVEFWYNPQKDRFDIRSASRVGQSDLGVNAKRLDYIGTRLEDEFGWKLDRRKNGSLV